MGQVRQDNVQIKLEIDGSQSRTELDNLTRKADVLREGMKGLKKNSEEYVAANKELGQVTKRMSELRDEIGLTSLTSNQLKALTGQLNRELANLTPNTESFAAKAKELAQVEARLVQVRNDARAVVDALEQGGNGFGSFVKKAAGFAGIQLGVEALVGGLKSAGQEVFDTTAKFETFEAVLTTALGSKSAAQAAMAQITDLAAKTPFSVEELTSSFVKFVNRGIVPTQAEMKKLADVAASQGKSFDQLAEAVLDAGTGEFERLKELGISASKAGDQVSLSFKGVTKTVENTPEAITKLLVSFGEVQGVMGATDGISATLSGQFSNLGDTADQTAVAWGQSLRPAFVAVLSTIGFLLGIFKELPRFVSENRGVLLALAGAVLTFNAAQVEANALLLYNAALSKGKVVWDTAVTFSTKAWEVAQRGVNLALKENPIGAVIAVGTLLVGVLVALYDKSEKFRAVVAGLGAVLKAFALTYVKGVIEQLTGLADILLGVFTLDAGRIKKGIQEVGTGLKATYYDAGKNAAAAYQQGYQGKLEEEQAKISARNGKLFDDAERAFQRRAEAAAKARIEAEKKASLEALKNREADIRAALALVTSGSAEELRLKKLDVVAKRDIELADEKKTAAERKVIKADAIAALRKLDEDYQKKQLAAAEKRAKDEAEVEKRIADLRTAFFTDETEKRIAQLIAAAEKEKATAKGTAAQIAEQRQLIEQKLALDVAEVRRQAAQKQKLEELAIEQQGNALIKNEWERRAAQLFTAAKMEEEKILATDKDGAEQRRLIRQKLKQDLLALSQEQALVEEEIAHRIADIDRSIALERLQRRKAEAGLFSKDLKVAALEEVRIKKDALQSEYELEIANTQLTNEQKLALKRKLDEDLRNIDREYRDWSDMNTKERFEFIAAQASQAVQLSADFAKIGSDKELAQAEKDKKNKLAKLESEYKAGTISKEKYEAEKSNIEANYDEKTRKIKQDAAEKEKEYNIAQAVIQTALAVVKAAPNVPLQIAAGLTGAASIAKIIATPIPEFEQGGVFGRAFRGVKQFARGGRINTKAGVADVGQRHSGGGIRMVDGATGEHLGEWERGEAYMILSRDTYTNNKYLVDELIDTSLHRGGAAVRPKQDYFEDGGTFATGPAASTSAAISNGGQELVQAVQRVEAAIKALPAWVRIHWDQDDTAELEQRLDERAEDRAAGEVR